MFEVENSIPIWEVLGLIMEQYDIQYPAKNDWTSILTKENLKKEQERMLVYQKQLDDMKLKLSADTSGNAN